ncbi:hypothetical protein EJ03DRAFT_386173 [Teratosphaeria nubilosa]|uniref:Uncharacterized protein n=1 Tax=Teratosphaeria nubilosa TaxID=161662 RepID=A0A6G1KU02_9PEZI|nr:hypothetical protein EJ03DRAFT_386173 [Teratosphaeria nubilosa]
MDYSRECELSYVDLGEKERFGEFLSKPNRSIRRIGIKKHSTEAYELLRKIKKASNRDMIGLRPPSSIPFDKIADLFDGVEQELSVVAVVDARDHRTHTAKILISRCRDAVNNALHEEHTYHQPSSIRDPLSPDRTYSLQLRLQISSFQIYSRFQQSIASATHE